MWIQPLRWLALLCVYAYYHITYRMRGWGRLPYRRGATLLVSNHQHEIETGAIVGALSVESLSWRYPIFAVAGRRMFEPGFLAERLPWSSFALREVDQSWLFVALGMQPVENELHTRSFSSLAHSIKLRHGDAPVREAFREEAVARLPAGVKSLSDLLSARYFRQARTRASLSELREPFRSEELAATRAQLEADVENFVHLLRDGATMFLTPEGHYTGDGRMRRMRGPLTALATLAEVWLVGISYDPFVGRRLSMLFRVATARGCQSIETQVKAIRPVSTSALLATWLSGRSDSFTAAQARDAVRSSLAELPPNVFVDPRLRDAPERMVRSALTGMQRLGTLRKDGDYFSITEQRAHPEFPRTLDMIEYQRNFHAETLEGARSM